MMYKKWMKRTLDVLISSLVLLFFAPVFVLLILCGALFMGGNPFFCQPRPGKGGQIFLLFKFRTMNNKKDAHGRLLSDAQRLTWYGKFLRSTSLDELPEVMNILLGDMSLVGPRPQLVRDLVFMTPAQKHRHDVPAGLTGLAQINGRNRISWEEKLAFDLVYVEKMSFLEDCRILLQTVVCVFQQRDITQEGMASAEDLGDYLLETGKITRADYDKKQEEARQMLEQFERART